MTNDSLGRELPRAKPITLTFYDSLYDVPFTTTFYVREEESDKKIEAMIKAIRDVSLCVLGQYKIGHRQFAVDGYREHLNEIPISLMGASKWVVKYRPARGSARSFTIPGRDSTLDINSSRSPIGKKGKAPDPENPKWKVLATLVKQICVSKEGEALMDWVGLDYRNEAWPPKGAR